MSARIKYPVLIGFVAVFFLYCLSAEVAPRWIGMADLYFDLKAKEGSILTPQEITAEMHQLSVKEKALRSSFEKNAGKYPRNEAGILEYFNDCAASSHLALKSIAPSTGASRSEEESPADGQSFRLGFDSDYHRLGKFINSLETGMIPVRINHLEATSGVQASGSRSSGSSLRKPMLSAILDVQVPRGLNEK